MDQDPNANKILQWLYQETAGRIPVGLRAVPSTDPPYQPSMEYALRVSQAELTPADPCPAIEQGKSYYAQAWLNFSHGSILDGILPLGNMAMVVSTPVYGVNAFQVRMPVYAFAHDKDTLAVRYDPELVTDLSAEELGNVLYLTLERCIEPDDYCDHHDLRRDRDDAFRYAHTVAESIINQDNSVAFASLHDQHVERFEAPMPWPERAITTYAKGGRIAITIYPKPDDA